MDAAGEIFRKRFTGRSVTALPTKILQVGLALSKMGT